MCSRSFSGRPLTMSKASIGGLSLLSMCVTGHAHKSELPVLHGWRSNKSLRIAIGFFFRPGWPYLLFFGVDCYIATASAIYRCIFEKLQYILSMDGPFSHGDLTRHAPLTSVLFDTSTGSLLLVELSREFHKSSYFFCWFNCPMCKLAKNSRGEERHTMEWEGSLTLILTKLSVFRAVVEHI